MRGISTLVREILLREAIMNQQRSLAAPAASRLVLLCIVGLMLLVAVSSPASGMMHEGIHEGMHEENNHADYHPDDQANDGTQRVKKIPLQAPIAGWQAIDHRHVILNFSAEQSYLLTLNRDCHGLTYADHLGVSTSNNAIYAGFDYVSADDQKCAISSINKLPRDIAH